MVVPHMARFFQQRSGFIYPFSVDGDHRQSDTRRTRFPIQLAHPLE